VARERIERAQRRLRELRELRAPSQPVPARAEEDERAASADPADPADAVDSSEPVEPPEEAPVVAEETPEEPHAGEEATGSAADASEDSSSGPTSPSEPGPSAPPAPERESLASRLQALRGGSVEPNDPHPGGAEDPRREATPTEDEPPAGSRSASGRVGDAWGTLSRTTRARIAALAIVAAIAGLILALTSSGTSCEEPGGDSCASGRDPIALVPGDALAYAHIDADPESEQLQAASAVSERVPLLSRLAISAVSQVAGRAVDYDTDVRPWTGGGMSMALVPGGARPEQVVMIEAADEAGARDFAEGLLGPGSATRDADGVELSVGKRGLAAGMLDGYLMVGDEDALAAIAEGQGDGESLEDTAAAALDELPELRLAYGYVSASGARDLLASDRSLSSLDTFVDADATAGAAAALSVEDGSLSLAVRSLLDPERAAASPSFFAALPRFEPQLDAVLSAGALAYLGLGDPGSSIESLLEQAAANAPALLSAFNRVEEDLRREGGISVTEDLLPLLGSEAAVAVEPVAAQTESQTPGVLASAGVPYLSVVADGVDSASAAKSLANLQAPLIDALAPVSSGKVPAFEESEIAGVVAQGLTVNPDIELTYATFDDRLVVATNPLGIEQARAGGDGLASSDAFAAATDGFPEEVSLIAYFNLQDLVALGEQIGLVSGVGGVLGAPDLRNLDAAAIAVDASGETLATDLRVTVGEPEASAADPPPPTGE